ncbi:MAG: hypothetical protein Aureis2KO_14150 [Aureisphaera sp.]
MGQNQHIDQLLERLQNAPPSLLPMNMYIENHFSQEEQELLFQYFSNNSAQHTNELPFSESFGSTAFYAQEIYNFNTQFGTIPLTPPFDFNPVGTPTNGILFADDYDGSGTLYGLEFSLSQLVIVDPVTGTKTNVGALTGLLPNHIPSGLSWDPVSETMYALSGDWDNPVFAEAQLYSVNLETGVLTPIGSPTTEPIGFWLAISNEGVAYVASSQNLYSMDLSTGEPTLIGAMGVSLNFTQDASFDPDTNILYAATFQSGQNGSISEINLATGEATILGTTNGDEYGSFSIYEDKDLGTGDNALQAISLFPNPTKGKVTVHAPFDIPIDTVELFNTLGSRQSIELKDNSIDLSHLNSGVYFLAITSNEKSVVKRIVKQ